MTEQQLLEDGPAAVRAAVEGGGSALNLPVLGQACAMRARSATQPDEASAWTDAAFACYETEAAGLTDEFVRNGRLVIAFGLRAHLSTRFRVPEKYLEDGIRWLQQGMAAFPDVTSFSEHLAATADGERHRHALLLQERLGAFVGPWRSGALPGHLDIWFRTARFSQE